MRDLRRPLRLEPRPGYWKRHVRRRVFRAPKTGRFDERLAGGAVPGQARPPRTRSRRVTRSFRDRDTQRFFEGRRVAAFQGFADQAARRLTPLDSAETLGDLAALPGSRLEAPRGDRAGQRRIRINVQWRICFRRTVEGPCDVEILDYH